MPFPVFSSTTLPDKTNGRSQDVNNKMTKANSRINFFILGLFLEVSTSNLIFYHQMYNFFCIAIINYEKNAITINNMGILLNSLPSA